jgi:hypothetical protein
LSGNSTSVHADAAPAEMQIANRNLVSTTIC